MKLFDFQNGERPGIPSHGYKLELWNITSYRATALAYLQRENVNAVENVNGRWYTIDQLKGAMLSQK